MNRLFILKGYIPRFEKYLKVRFHKYQRTYRHYQCLFRKNLNLCSFWLDSPVLSFTIQTLESINETSNVQKQPSSSVLRKRCPENIQQLYTNTPMLKCDFNKVAKLESSLRHGCSSVNLLYIFRTPFPKSTSRGLFLNVKG